MEIKVVSNTGPILHLSEINLLKALTIFNKIYIPSEVESELRKNNIRSLPKYIKKIDLLHKSKDIAGILINKFSLDLGESQAIALALQEKAHYFLTDDLDARSISKDYGIEAHGTAGIILRAFRNKIINKKTAIQKVKELQINSTLFITKDLIYYIIKSIQDYK